MKKHLPIILLTTILGLVHCKASASYESQEQRKQALLLNTLNSAAVCLAEQIKAPENRHRILNSTGIIAANVLTAAIEKLSGPKISLAMRLLGAHLGEGASLVKAVKERRLKAHLTTLTKRDIAALITKTILTSLVTPRAINEFKRQADDDKEDDNKKVEEIMDLIEQLKAAGTPFEEAIENFQTYGNECLLQRYRIKTATPEELNHILTKSLNLSVNPINQALMRLYQQRVPSFCPDITRNEHEAIGFILKIKVADQIDYRDDSDTETARDEIPGLTTAKADQLRESSSAFADTMYKYNDSSPTLNRLACDRMIKAAMTLDKIDGILEKELKLKVTPANRALMCIEQLKIPNDIADPKYNYEEKAA